MNSKREIPKVWGFGTYIQCCYDEYPAILRDQQAPSKARVLKLVERMNEYAVLFDCVYTPFKRHAANHKFQEEIESWSILSPCVHSHLVDVTRLLKYERSLDDRLDETVSHIRNGWDLVQEWNVLSNSYKAKINIIPVHREPRPNRPSLFKFCRQP